MLPAPGHAPHHLAACSYRRHRTDYAFAMPCLVRHCHDTGLALFSMVTRRARRSLTTMTAAHNSARSRRTHLRLGGTLASRIPPTIWFPIVGAGAVHWAADLTRRRRTRHSFSTFWRTDCLFLSHRCYRGYAGVPEPLALFAYRPLVRQVRTARHMVALRLSTADLYFCVRASGTPTRFTTPGMPP